MTKRSGCRRHVAIALSLCRRLFDAPEIIGAHLMDGDLLLLSMLSEELAARVIAFRPSLQGQVDAARRDPAKTVREWKAAIRGESPP